MFEKLDRFIEENPEEMLVTGGWSDEKIAEMEKEVRLVFREELKEFIRRYGLLLGYGLAIEACCKDGSSTVVEDTLNCRQIGLDNRYLVIENCDEIKYCMDSETGKIVNWGPDNGEAYPEADDLESFIMKRLEEGQEDW